MHGTVDIALRARYLIGYMLELHAFCDGGSRGNPGPAATGWVVFDGSCVATNGMFPEVVCEQPVASGSRFLNNQTNNVAEYSAVSDCITALNEKNIKKAVIHVYLDSELIVKQLLGEYKVKQPHLKPMFERLSAEIRRLRMNNMVYITHVPREYNTHADALVNKTLDEHG